MNRYHFIWGFGLAAILLFLPPWAAAQTNIAATAPPPPAISVAGDVGFGGISGQPYTTLQSGLDIQEGYLAFGILGRLRLNMDAQADESVLRSRDWDEASDFLHILRYLNYQHRLMQMNLTAHVGEVASYTLGHGSIIRDYTNLADPDHQRSGFTVSLDSQRWNYRGLVDNIVNPSLIGQRATVMPFTRLPNLRLGASLVLDPQAPREISLDALGARQIDGAYNLMAESEVFSIWGFDADYQFGDESTGQLTSYADFNTSFYGSGLHAGGLGLIPVRGTRVRLSGQVEYRLSSDGYAPEHMGTFYDVERYQSGLSFSDPAAASISYRSPKLAGVARGIYGGQGILATAGVDWNYRLQLRAGFSGRPGPDGNTVWARASGQANRRLEMGALVLVRGLDTPQSSATGLMAMAETRYRLTNQIYLLGQYTRTWALNETTTYYDSIQAINLAMGGMWWD